MCLYSKTNVLGSKSWSQFYIQMFTAGSALHKLQQSALNLPMYRCIYILCFNQIFQVSITIQLRIPKISQLNLAAMFCQL